MDIKQITESITDGGIYTTNFFNGRLLTGEDLQTDQAANRQGRKRLGRAIGDGVAYGLEVSEAVGLSNSNAPVVTVTAGLAVNRTGLTLALDDDVNIGLKRSAGSVAISTSSFEDCKEAAGGKYVAGEGLYLLTIGPASASAGRALVSSLGNVAAGCNTRYNIEGVQFRLIQIDMLNDLNLTTNQLGDSAHIRNRAAYSCFTPGLTTSFLADAFGPPPSATYGLLDALRPNRLTDCEAPLALVYWTTANGLEFVDMWSVRRRITQRPVGGHWSALLDDRRIAETEAMLLQFQGQIKDMFASPTALSSIAANSLFEYLPPVGVLPISGLGSARGFSTGAFFGSKGSVDLALTDANLVRAMMRESLYHDPINLSDPEKIQLYLVWENLMAVDSQQSGQLEVVFASHTLPYRGVARFGLSKWGLGRFAPTVV